MQIRDALKKASRFGKSSWHKYKILTPVSEESKGKSTVCKHSYKKVFKKSKDSLKIMKIGINATGPFFKSPRRLFIDNNN